MTCNEIEISSICEQGPEGIAGPGLITITSELLNLTIDSFSFLDAQGAAVTISTQSIDLYANNASYIILDYGTLTYVILNKAIHFGGVCVCQVITSDDDVTNIKILFDRNKIKTAIPNFLNKSSTSQVSGNIRIAILGDSLLEGAGGTPIWQDLLFNSAYVSEGFNIPNLANVTINNHAIGGATSHYGLTLIGEGAYSNTGEFQNTAMNFGPSANAQVYSPPKLDGGRSPFIKQPYDLLIIGFGANGGTFDLGYLENIIIECRKVGTEIILVTENFRSDNADFLLNHFPYWEKMCQSHGCALADTWDYMLSSQNAGNDVLEDTIHPSAIGQVAWATAITGIINPMFALEPIPAKLPNDRVVRNNSATDAYWGLLNNSCQLSFTPVFPTSGTTFQPTTATSVDKNPALLYGNRTASNAATVLTIGQIAYFAHPWAFGVDFLVDAATTFTADIKTSNGGVTLGSISWDSAFSGRAIVIEGINGADYADINTTCRVNRGIQLECTSGTLTLLAVIFHSDKVMEFNILSDINYIGTWGSEAFIWDIPVSKYTDTNHDSLNFDYYGSDCVVYLNHQNAAGIVDVYLDGKIIYEQLDLYSTGDLLYPLWIFGNSSTDYQARTPGPHSVQIRLNGVNGSANAPGSGNRRLQVAGTHVFDRS